MADRFSDAELLALASIGGRTPRGQREHQAELVAEFVQFESQPSCSLVKQRRWSRGENARHQGIARRLRQLGGEAA